MDNKGSGIVYLLITVLIAALIALFMLNTMKPKQSDSNQINGNNVVQQAQETVDQINDRLNQYE